MSVLATRPLHSIHMSLKPVPGVARHSIAPVGEIGIRQETCKSCMPKRRLFSPECKSPD